MEKVGRPKPPFTVDPNVTLSTILPIISSAIPSKPAVTAASSRNAIHKIGSARSARAWHAECQILITKANDLGGFSLKVWIVNLDAEDGAVACPSPRTSVSGAARRAQSDARFGALSAGRVRQRAQFRRADRVHGPDRKADEARRPGIKACPFRARGLSRPLCAAAYKHKPLIKAVL